MPRLKLRQIQAELFRYRRTFAVVPAVREQNSTHIEEDYVEGKHQLLISALSRQGSLSITGSLKLF
jgi:hypothetical protein